MKNYSQAGEILTFTAPTAGVVTGLPYLIGSLVVVATETAAETVAFRALVSGVVLGPKTAAQAWTEGAKIYADTSGANEFTTTAGGNVLCGVAAAAADNPSDEGYVRLDGVAR